MRATPDPLSPKNLGVLQPVRLGYFTPLPLKISQRDAARKADCPRPPATHALEGRVMGEYWWVITRQEYVVGDT